MIIVVYQVVYIRPIKSHTSYKHFVPTQAIFVSFNVCLKLNLIINYPLPLKKLIKIQAIL